MFADSLKKLFRSLGRFVFIAILLLHGLHQNTQAAVLAQGPLPAQPANINAFHRSGQTFITWSEVTTLVGEKYRIYRHHEPINSSNIGAATLIFEVGEDSSRFFGSRYYNEVITQWSHRHSERLVINDLSAPLNNTTGLLVWTVGPEDFGGGGQGTGYYAVTTVSYQGVENRSNFGAGNVTGAVSEAVGTPEPVEINHSLGSGWHVFIQYMDIRRWNPTFHAPSVLNSYYGFSSNDVRVTNASVYAYDYAVYTPGPAECGSVPQQMPVILSLHAFQGNNKFVPQTTKFNYCAYQIFPVDQMNTWWFGFAKNYNYRAYTNGSYPGSGDVIVNFTEQRLLRMIADLIRDPVGPSVDTNRIYVQGHSMGGSGALSLAMRYSNVFAAADASKPMTNYRTTTSFFLNDISVRWGQPGAGLPVQLDAPNGWAAHLQGRNGTNVWDFQNHQQNLQNRPADLIVPLGVNHSQTDTTVVWNTQGQPVYVPFNASRQVWGAEIRSDRHDDALKTGLPPNLAPDASGAPFWGLKVVKNETKPGLSNGSANLPLPPNGNGNYNHTVMWSASWNPWDGPPEDTATSWQVSLCAVNATSTVYACGSGVNQTIDVTPRHTQHFHLAPGAVYAWENRRVSDGGLIASGTVTADGNGLVTVPGVAVSPSGVRLRIYSGSPPPTQPVPPTPTFTPVTPSATSQPPTATNTPVTPPPATATNTPVTPPPATATNTPVTPSPATATNTPVTPPPATATNTPVTPPPATATNTQAPPPTNTPVSGAGNTGWKVAANDSPGVGGDANGFEVDRPNMFADDGLFAASMDTGTNTSITCNGPLEDNHHFMNFDFAIPANLTIDGLEIRLDSWADDLAGAPQLCVQFSWNNGRGWSTIRTVQLTTTETTYMIGSPTDDWGFDFVPAHLSNGNFRIRVILDATNADRDFFLDYLAVRVHYH